MKKITESLFSDAWIAKIRNLPNFVWYLIGTALFFFANAYLTLNNSESVAIMLMASSEEYAEAMAVSSVSLNPIAVMVLATVLDAIFEELFAEIVIYLISSTFSTRFAAIGGRTDVRFRLRLAVMYANIVIGTVGIAYFFTQTLDGSFTGPAQFLQSDTVYNNDIYYIATAIVPFSVYALFGYIFYEDCRKNFLPIRNHANCFLYVVRIVLGIALIVSLYNLIAQLWIYSGTDLRPAEIASLCVDFAVKVIWTVLAYLYYRYLKKISVEPEDIQIKIIPDEKHNIFDEFGF